MENKEEAKPLSLQEAKPDFEKIGYEWADENHYRGEQKLFFAIGVSRAYESCWNIHVEPLKSQLSSKEEELKSLRSTFDAMEAQLSSCEIANSVKEERIRELEEQLKAAEALYNYILNHVDLNSLRKNRDEKRPGVSLSPTAKKMLEAMEKYETP